jgi:hypothetical protein
MNERIKELWEDSDAIEVCYPEQGSPVSVSAKTLETFAELIVQECILTIQMGITRDGYDTEKYQRSMKHIKQIKEHFGVEE